VSVTILDREMYNESVAARLLRVAPSTLHWWLEGREKSFSSESNGQCAVGHSYELTQQAA
jgi:hypothetical protein